LNADPFLSVIKGNRISQRWRVRDDDLGRTLFSEDITADGLDGAIRHASNVLHTSNLPWSSRRVYAFEVWSGTSRLFPLPFNA
jgi:hypothetical protein